MFKKYVKTEKIGDKLTEYRTMVSRKGILRETLIGGFKATIMEIGGKDPSFKAYLLQRGYQNLYSAIQRSKIPLMTIYLLDNDKTGIYLITKGGNEDELERNIRIIEASFYAVFPKAKMERLSGREVKKLMLFNSLHLDENNLPPIIDENSMKDLGLVTHQLPPFRTPVIRNREPGGIYVGRLITQYGDEGEPYMLSRKDISSHVVCVGVTGSGKTTTVATILNSLPTDIKYMVLDFHNEYTGLLNNYDLVIRPGMDDQYAINPLKPLEGIDYNEHMSMVTDIFADTYNFTHSQSYIFKLALEATLSKYDTGELDEPDMEALVDILERMPIGSYYEIESKAALKRRLKPLTQGQAKKAFCGKKYLRIDQAIASNVIIELGGLREIKLRQIYSKLLLKQIYDYRTLTGQSRLNHIIVIEEASYIVPYRRDYDQPTIAERMVNEMRKFGESIILITQFPTQIPKDTVKNAGLLLIHRLTGVEDLKTLQSIMNISNEQIDYIKQLETGICVVRDSSNMEPFLVHVYPRVKGQGKNLFKSPFSDTSPSQST